MKAPVRVPERLKRAWRWFAAPPTAEGAFFSVTLATVGWYLLWSLVFVLFQNGVAHPLLYLPLILTPLMLIFHADTTVLRHCAAAAKRSRWFVSIPLLLIFCAETAAVMAIMQDGTAKALMYFGEAVLFSQLFAAWAAPLLLRKARKTAVLQAVLWTLAIGLLSAVVVWTAIDFRNAVCMGPDYRMREIGDVLPLPRRWQWMFKFLEAVGYDAALMIALAALAGAWFATGRMLTETAGIPLGKCFSRRIAALWVLFFLGYGGLMAYALCGEHRFDSCRAVLERHFGRPLSIQAWQRWVETGRRRDPGFWKRPEFADVKDYTYSGKLWYSDELGDLWQSDLDAAMPGSVLRKWREKFDSQRGLKECEALFDAKLPVFPRQYVPGDLWKQENAPVLTFMKSMVCIQAWRVRFALEQRDREALHTAFRRMDTAIDFLSVEGPFTSGIFSLRNVARKLWLSSGQATNAELRELAAQLAREDAGIPKFADENLYLECLTSVLDFIDRVRDHRPYYPEALPKLRSDWRMFGIVFPALWGAARFALSSGLENSIWPASLEDPGAKPIAVHIKFYLAKLRALRMLLDAELERRETGKFPAALKNPPDDPFTGEPMKYRAGKLRHSVKGVRDAEGNLPTVTRIVDGAAAWSVGRDRVDGGTYLPAGNDDYCDDIGAVIAIPPSEEVKR